jgi:hypothetical protein
MNERINEIIKLREKNLELALLLKNKLDIKASEDTIDLINSIITGIENNINSVNFNDEYVSYRLPSSNLQNYVINFSTEASRFKETFNEYIDTSDLQFTNEFVMMFIRSGIISNMYMFYGENRNRKMIFNFNDIKEILKSLNIELNYDQENESLIVTMRIPSLDEYNTRKRTFKF